MEYTIYKFKFITGVHFGNGDLEDAEIVLHADTIFSALCQEAVKDNEQTLARLVTYAQEGRLCISDAFPYIDKMYYLPKPALRIQTEKDSGDSKEKKKFKKLKYIPVSQLSQYLQGKFSIDTMNNFSSDLGKSYIKTSVSIRGEEESTPYRVGAYYFNENAGLYIILGYENEDVKRMVEDLLLGLSYEGLGGKRSSGLGRYELFPHYGAFPEELQARINQPSEYQMTLSVSLPKEQELDKAIQNAQYKMIKRSGFVASSKYADEFRRKKDLYVFDSGSCFINAYEGDVYDVSEGGTHPVYRYAKPLFLGVEV